MEYTNAKTVLSQVDQLYSEFEDTIDSGDNKLRLLHSLDSPSNKPDLRERLLKFGAAHLRDRELIAVLLGSGIKGCPVLQIAQQVRTILETIDMQNIPREIAAIKGLGNARISVILAALELGRRRFAPKERRILSAEDAQREFSLYSGEMQEYFLCLILNGARELLETRIISVGTIDRTLVHPRELFAPAIARRGAAIIMGHNHPSGVSNPSELDCDLTNRMFYAGSLLGIQVLDHVIVSKSGYYSFAEHSRMPDISRISSGSYTRIFTPIH